MSVVRKSYFPTKLYSVLLRKDGDTFCEDVHVSLIKGEITPFAAIEQYFVSNGYEVLSIRSVEMLTIIDY